MKFAQILVVSLALAACSTHVKKKHADAPIAPQTPPTAEPEKAPLADDTVATLQSNRYRGYDAVNYALSQRLVDDPNFQLSYYIEDTSDLGIFAAFVTTLKDLLGGRFGTGLLSGFRNGSPNSVNLTLWQVAFNGLASDVKGICQADNSKIGPFQTRAAFRDAALALCAWPLDKATRGPALAAFYQEIMQYDAPSNEREAWLAFAVSEDMLALPADQALYNLTFAALYNPHMLISK